MAMANMAMCLTLHLSGVRVSGYSLYFEQSAVDNSSRKTRYFCLTKERPDAGAMNHTTHVHLHADLRKCKS